VEFSPYTLTILTFFGAHKFLLPETHKKISALALPATSNSRKRKWFFSRGDRFARDFLSPCFNP
jgi:hypothetical protein